MTVPNVGQSTTAFTPTSSSGRPPWAALAILNRPSEIAVTVPRTSNGRPTSLRDQPPVPTHTAVPTPALETPVDAECAGRGEDKAGSVPQGGRLFERLAFGDAEDRRDGDKAETLDEPKPAQEEADHPEDQNSDSHGGNLRWCG